MHIEFMGEGGSYSKTAGAEQKEINKMLKLDDEVALLRFLELWVKHPTTEVFGQANEQHFGKKLFLTSSRCHTRIWYGQFHSRNRQGVYANGSYFDSMGENLLFHASGFLFDSIRRGLVQEIEQIIGYDERSIFEL